MGGTVAFEIAQQLREQGQQVTLLALLDTPRPARRNPLNRGIRRFQRLAYRGRRFAHHMRNLLVLRPGEHPRYVLEKAGIVKKLMTPDPPVRQANHRATRRYVVQAYPGRISLFLPNETPVRASRDSRLAWRELAAGGLEVYMVPGDQVSMLREPHVQVLAQRLQDCLDRAAG